MRVSPTTGIALVALFFALGGSAVAVTEAVKPQARCQPGAVRAFVSVTGDPTKSLANLPDQFTSTKALFGARFNCAGAAPQARRVNVGVYEVRFPGTTSTIATASAGAAEVTVANLGGGTFRVSLWVPGRADAIDTPFVVFAV
ncbi:MAG: hypothetical protein H0W16_14585 [Actinobacteria bacterium]|nr:hypothetical protein [Actinomycetota bacterium]